MSIQDPCIGCDVSKRHLDLFDAARTTSARIANTPDAIAAFLETLAGRSVFVVFEATGSYDTGLRRALEQASVPFARVNPERARSFARAEGILAKTDKVDARMLAEMGRKLELGPDPASCPKRRRLAALTRRRDQLVAMRKQEQTRLREVEEPDIVACIRDHIDWLKAHIWAADKQIQTLIASDKALSREARMMRSVPGVGPVTSSVLLSLMPELGIATRRAAAALAGVAPINDDSGRRRGQRRIRGGRKRVRDALYIAALTACRTSPRFKRFYEALRNEGKKAKVALIAVARKLLVVINAMMRQGTDYQEARI